MHQTKYKLRTFTGVTLTYIIGASVDRCRINFERSVRVNLRTEAGIIIGLFGIYAAFQLLLTHV